MQTLNRKRDYILLTAPALLIYMGLMLFPVVYSFFLGFFKWDGSSALEFIGLSNYNRMFTDPVFYLGLKNNLLIVLVSIAGQIPFGFLFAYIIHRKLVKGTQFFQAMIFLPVVISAIVVAILWNQIFAPGGILTSIIRILKDDPRYVFGVFENKTWAMVPVLFVIFWLYTGTYMIIFLANMKRIPESIIESAFIDGAKEKDVLLKIILPNMIPVVHTTMVFAIAGSLKSFGLIFAMTAGGPAHFTEVVAIYMYQNTFKYYNYGYGSAISIIMVLMSIGFITILQQVFKHLENKYK